MRADCTLLAIAGVAAGSVASQGGKPLRPELHQYRGWAMANPEPMQLSTSMTFLCRGPDMNPKSIDGPHIHRYIRVFVNSVGKSAMDSGRPFPVGSAIVKEKTRGKGGPVELSTFMVKREKGFNPKCGDWEFGVIDGPTQKVVEKGKIDRCMKCHMAKRDLDFTFRSYLPKKG
jgi:hypothetical protein